MPVDGVKNTAEVVETVGVWFDPAAATPTMYWVVAATLAVALIAVLGPDPDGMKAIKADIKERVRDEIMTKSQSGGGGGSNKPKVIKLD